MPNAYGLSSREVCEVVGITYRQLNYWCNRVPQLARHRKTGSGEHRTFTENDVEIIRRVAELTEALAETKRQLNGYGLWRVEPRGNPR